MVIRNNIIPFKGYKLINIFGLIFVRKNATIRDSDLNHEAIHTAQMRELLYILFYIWYIIEFIIRFIGTGFKWKLAYRNIWFEQEAYDYQDCRCYLEHRSHYKWFNYKTMNNGTLNYNYHNKPSCCTRQNYKEDRNKFDPSYPDPKDERFGPDYSQEYLTFVALEDGTFIFTNAVNYSLDGGKTWEELSANTASPEVKKGKKIMWKGELTPSMGSGIGTFSSTGNFNAQGNVMSLLFGDDFKDKTTLAGKDYAFYELFYQNQKLINAKDLQLPATTLRSYCYYQMFWLCSNLTTAPKLPASSLAVGCYKDMFGACGITEAPILPAKLMSSGCYSGMFQGCVNLRVAPELPATTLASNCYEMMFSGCLNLNYIKAMFTTTPSATYTNNWVSGVAPTGTFVKNPEATWNVTGANGVPSGWTVE